MLASLLYREEVVGCELPHLAGEAGAAIGEEDFGLADAAWVEEYVAAGGVASVVFVAHPQVEVAQRYPARLAAPAAMDQLLAVGQQLAESGAGLWCVFFLHPGRKSIWPCGDAEHGHG